MYTPNNTTIQYLPCVIILPIISFSNASFADNGNYMCNMSNAFGWTCEQGSLRIKKATIIAKGNMSDSNVEVGQTLMLVCSVNHDKDVNLDIKWVKDGMHISLDEELFSSITIRRRSKNKYQTEEFLTIHNSTKRHSGEYTCLAETEMDYDQIKYIIKVKLKVNYIVVYISVSICLITATITYFTYPFFKQRNK